MSGSEPILVEGFILDRAFVNQSSEINGFLTSGTGKIASLTQKSLSYFNQPDLYPDTRLASTREVEWATTTSPQILLDQTIYGNFITTINGLSSPITTGLFKIIDTLLFNYNSATTHTALEAAILADSDMAAIYTPGSFTLATAITATPVHLQNGTTQTVNIPAFCTFTISFLSGQTTVSYLLTLYASNDAFLSAYSTTTIIDVIPPLDYNTLYTTSLVATTGSVFATASASSELMYNSTQALFGNVQISGMEEYNTVITDGDGNSVGVPFNILYKGRAPTLFEIRNAIQTALLNSGIGTSNGWQARIPGVFIAGRFYVIPMWGDTYTKPNQTLFPRILNYQQLGNVTNTILASLGTPDVTPYMDVLSAYYNKMTATAVPDLSGNTQVGHLQSVIPDYQDYSQTDVGFAYMLAQTQGFVENLNAILTLDTTNQSSTTYTTITENLLTFYSFTVATYEICVITKFCYETLTGASQ